jgi:hypothetical protein
MLIQIRNPDPIGINMDIRFFYADPQHCPLRSLIEAVQRYLFIAHEDWAI